MIPAEMNSPTASATVKPVRTESGRVDMTTSKAGQHDDQSTVPSPLPAEDRAGLPTRPGRYPGSKHTRMDP